MIESPFWFDDGRLTAADFQKLGQLATRWSFIEHVLANCLRVMLSLSMEQAVVMVFPLTTEQRLQKIKQLAKITPINDEAVSALAELEAVMKGLQIVRNDAIHGIVADGEGGIGPVFHNRAKGREFTLAQLFSCEELTNYAGHAVLSLRYALGIKDGEGKRYPLPERPAVPEFLRDKIPPRRKAI